MAPCGAPEPQQGEGASVCGRLASAVLRANLGAVTLLHTLPCQVRCLIPSPVQYRQPPDGDGNGEGREEGVPTEGAGSSERSTSREKRKMQAARWAVVMEDC